jgi:hypothetical protein
MTRPGRGPLHPSHTGFQHQSPAESRRAPIRSTYLKPRQSQEKSLRTGTSPIA